MAKDVLSETKSERIEKRQVLSALAFSCSIVWLGVLALAVPHDPSSRLITVMIAVVVAITTFAVTARGFGQSLSKLSAENLSLRAVHQCELDSHKQALSGFSAVCVLDTENRIVEANDEFTKLLTNTNSLALVPLERALPALVGTPFWNALLTHNFWSGDVELELQGSDRRVYLLTALPQLSADGRLIRTLLVMFDRTEEKVGVVDDMLHATLEHLNEDVYVYDVDTLEVRYMNEKARARCKWQMDDLQQKRIHDTVPNFDVSLFRRHSSPIVLGEKESATVQVMSQTGPVEIVTRMIIGLDNKRLFVSTLRDLADRHEIEEARMESVSMISHELRTPLTSIKGSLSLLKSGTLGDFPTPASQILNIADRNSDRLLTMINDILDYEKLAAGKMTYLDKKVELRELITETLENMHSYAEANDVILVHSLPSTAIFTYGDRNRLMQVLVNLVSNAAKFSPSGTQVSIALNAEPKSWRISVKDQGPGIPASMLPKIGQPFTQFEVTHGKQTLGTGLGLTIVKRILGHYKSELTIATSEGDGSEFSFVLQDYATLLKENDQKLLSFNHDKERPQYGT